MARVSTISFDQVAAAANAIKAAGDKPTARRVREALGTGSMATILKHFQRWQGGSSNSNSTDQVEEQTTASIDHTIVKAIMTAIAAQVAAANVEAAKKITELEGEITALIQENERLTIDNNDLDIEMDALKQKAAALARNVEMNSGELMSLADQVETERNGRISAEQTAAVLTAQMADAENRAKEATADKAAYYELLLLSQKKADELSRELTDELRGRLNSKANKKTGSANSEMPANTKTTRTKAKATPAPSPTSV